MRQKEALFGRGRIGQFILYAVVASGWFAPAPGAAFTTYDGDYRGTLLPATSECGARSVVSMTIVQGRVRMVFAKVDHLIIGIIDETGSVKASGFWMGLRNKAVEIYLKGKVANGQILASARDDRCVFSVSLVRQSSSDVEVPS